MCVVAVFVQVVFVVVFSVILSMLSLYFLATLVALHLTPVSKWVGEWVVVSEKRSLELASLLDKLQSLVSVINPLVGRSF